ncbi:DEAD/DEAH box helicase family protein [Lentibacillus salinarum]|uniref:DEAD/DEAH box helicase family protein n=1 Tax=Lentibacillus salinarum TaxID=446820 RepID=A0ABW3ZY24_9BACI
MDIKMYANERHFDGKLHLAAIDDDSEIGEHLVFSSFVGLPEAVRAMTAGFVEGRPMRIEHDEYRGFSGEHHKMLVKPIGQGDVAHGMVYHAQATIDGISDIANAEEEDTLKGYIVCTDGDVGTAIAEHVIRRFSLPNAWKAEYSSIFSPFIRELKVIRNQAFQNLWPDFKMFRLNISEKQVKVLITEKISEGVLKIEQGDLNGTFHPGMSMKEYLTENAKILAKKLRNKEPRYLQGAPIHPSIGDMARVPFPSQAGVVQGLWNVFQDGNPMTMVNGAMGVGKTIIACAMANRFHAENIKNGKSGSAFLISAPSITLNKWKYEEILKTLPNAKVTIINSTEQALKLLDKVRNGYKPQGMEFYLLSLDRAKLGHVPHFAGIWKRVRGSKHQYTWHCPDCYQPLVKKDEDGEEYVHVEWDDIAEGEAPDPDDLRAYDSLNPNGLSFVPKWKKKAKQFGKCNHHLMTGEEPSCNSKLWRPAVKSRGETRMKDRWNISLIMKKIKGFFDLYICDEVHQAKAEDSGRGDAFGQLVQAAPKQLLLTGTLTTGLSSSIKEILWKTMPYHLLKQGFDHRTSAVAWARRYGKIKTVINHEEQDNGWVVRKKRKAQQPREEAGISPQLTVQLLDFTAFLDLPDIGLPLVNLKEEAEIVKLDDDHEAKYKVFHEELHQACKTKAHAGSKGAFAKFIPATINYADNPSLGARVAFTKVDKSGTKSVETFEAEALPKDYFTAKERKLVETVRKELDQGRGCVIYNNYTGTYEMNDRTKYVLEVHGIDATILNESNTLKRSEKLKQLENDGVKVIICQMKLVEVGLDLMAWPTIIFNQLNYEINTVRQASRRAWRVGQDKECKVIYLVADGTQEMSQFLHLVKQRSHALMVEGVMDKSPLSGYAQDEQNNLASDLANCFADSGLADVWKSLADKELEHVEMVDEANFKDVLQERMEQLSNKTRELCGLPPMQEMQSEQPVLEGVSKEQSDNVDVIDMDDYIKHDDSDSKTNGQLAFELI